MTPHPTAIEHRSVENHYTTEVSYIAQCTYTYGRLTPPPTAIEHRSVENHYTTEVSYIAQCIYTHGRLTSPHRSIEHRCLEHHYAKLGRSNGRSTGRYTPHQSSIDALNTATPNLADLMASLPPNQA